MALKVGQLRAPRGRRGQLSGFLPPSHINRLLAANFRVMQARAAHRVSPTRMPAVHITSSLGVIGHWFLALMPAPSCRNLHEGSANNIVRSDDYYFPA